MEPTEMRQGPAVGVVPIAMPVAVTRSVVPLACVMPAGLTVMAAVVPAEVHTETDVATRRCRAGRSEYEGQRACRYQS